MAACATAATRYRASDGPAGVLQLAGQALSHPWARISNPSNDGEVI